MDEAEAETAMLALGPRLSWTLEANDNVLEDWYSETFGGDVRHRRGRFYRTYKDKRNGHYHVLFYENYLLDDQCPVSHLSERDAKAACERHHATGKWD